MARETTSVLYTQMPQETPASAEQHRPAIVVYCAEVHVMRRHAERSLAVKLIANVDRSWGIGRSGGMLFHIPEDLRFFRSCTMGGAVIMGRKTLESLPGGRPLPGRLNIVLTHKNDIEETDMLRVCGGIEEACAAAEQSGIADDVVFVIGGQHIYEQMQDLCDEALITKVDADGEADRFMPDLDADPAWTPVDILGAGEMDGLSYRFIRYKRQAVPLL